MTDASTLTTEPGSTWTGKGYTWTTFADDVIRTHYPDGGKEACHAILPNRTIDAINRRACSLGVKRNDPTRRRRSAPVVATQAAPEPESHLIWMEVDRVMRGIAVGVLAPRLVTYG